MYIKKGGVQGWEPILKKDKANKSTRTHVTNNITIKTSLKASPAVLSMGSCTVKMDEENPTCACLTQKNCLGWLSIMAQVAVAGKMLHSSVHLQKRV